MKHPRHPLDSTLYKVFVGFVVVLMIAVAIIDTALYARKVAAEVHKSARKSCPCPSWCGCPHCQGQGKCDCHIQEGKPCK